MDEIYLDFEEDRANDDEDIDLDDYNFAIAGEDYIVQG